MIKLNYAFDLCQSYLLHFRLVAESGMYKCGLIHYITIELAIYRQLDIFDLCNHVGVHYERSVVPNRWVGKDVMQNA